MMHHITRHADKTKWSTNVTIDWYEKVEELKQMADELDHWAAKSPGQGRLVLGRISDELKRFASEISALLREPESGQAAEPVPDWLSAAGVEPVDTGDEWEEGEWEEFEGGE